MRPYLVLMVFALIALSCGQTEARTVVRRSKSVIKQHVVQRLHTPSHNAMRLQILKVRGGICSNGQCR